MPGELIITNGDVAANILKKADIGDEILPWRDVLHEGPVPQSDDLPALSVVRAQYLATANHRELAELNCEFTERDDLLARNERFDDVTLWFEHDLYDQLQLIQILAWFADHWRDDGRVFLVQADDHLGMQTPETIGRFAGRRAPVTGLQLSMAKIAWAAFCHETPEPWAKLLDEDLTALPFLKAAALRMVQELPAPDNGLTRTQFEILTRISDGERRPMHLFADFGHDSVEPRFMGDASFFIILDDMLDAGAPMIHGRKGPRWQSLDWEETDDYKTYLASLLQLTSFGKEVLAGRADQVALNGIDRWWGGTLLTPDNLWRWDGHNKKLIAP